MTKAGHTIQEQFLPTDIKQSIEQAVKALIKLIEVRETGTRPNGKLDLLADDEAKPIFVQLSLKRIPEVKGGMSLRSKPLTVSKLPHSLYNDELNTCLVVADVAGSKRDREKTAQVWKELLVEKGITCVNHIISARSLRTDYHAFEARRKLAHAFDTFLMDKRLRMRSQEWFGSAFFAHGRIPICVSLNKWNENDAESERALSQYICNETSKRSGSKDNQMDTDSEDSDSNDKAGAGQNWLKSEFERAFKSTVLSLSVRGPCSNALVGYSKMTEQQLVDNVSAFFNAIIRRLPGGLENVRAAHVKCKQTRAVPFYTSGTANLTDEAKTSVHNFEQSVSNRSQFRTLKQAATAGISTKQQKSKPSKKLGKDKVPAKRKVEQRDVKKRKAVKREASGLSAKKRKV